MSKDNLMFIGTLLLSSSLVLSGNDIGFVLMGIGITNRYLADIDKSIKG